MTTSSTSQPTAIEFPSGNGRCVGALWLPAGADDAAPLPVVLLAHGLGGTFAMGLAAYAERFAAAGVAAVAFDYRSFGESPGEPRNEISIPRQRQDWHAAIAFAKQDERFDSERIAIWGSSFAGGHVIAVGAEHPELAAVVSQCPFTDGLASALRLNPLSSLRVSARGVADVVATAFGARVRVPVAGTSPGAALMTAPDALPGYRRLLSVAGDEAMLSVPAKVGLAIPLARPGSRLRKLRVPTLVCICEGDSVAPDGATRRYVRHAHNANVDAREYPFGHFDIYQGPGFEQVAGDQTEFLVQQLIGASAPAVQDAAAETASS